MIHLHDAELTASGLGTALQRLGAQSQLWTQELNAADAALGDGDIGITVSRGFAEAAQAVLPDDVGQALFETAKALQRVSASSYGTLLATGFMAAAKLCVGRSAVPLAELPVLLDASVAAMMARGKGKLGDKTVLDVLQAVADSLRDVAACDRYPAAITAARDTLELYKTRQNLLGRARMFAEASIGRYDPGQLAMVRMIEALAPDQSGESA